MDVISDLSTHGYDSESSESSTSSCGSCHSIIWIGDKRKTPDLTESTGTIEISGRTESTTSVSSETTEASESSETSETTQTSEVSKTIDESNANEILNKNETVYQFDIRNDSETLENDSSETTEIPESSESTQLSECSKSIESGLSEYDSDEMLEKGNDYYSDGTERGSESLSVAAKKKELVDPEQIWKTFTDDEFKAGTLKVTVPKRSFFSYLKVNKEPVYLINEPNKYDLKDIVSDMVLNNKGAYAHVKIESHVFDCIPSLLKVYSPWFANQERSAVDFQFNEHDVPAIAFKAIYKWMSHNTPIKLRNAVKVMQAAKYLKIDILIDECWKLICKPTVKEKIAFELYCNAGNLAELDEIRNLMLSRIRSYFLPMLGTEDFLKLKLAQLTNLIKLDTIGVNSEVEVFFAAIRWISYNPPDRLPHMKTIMDCIRFPYMSMTTLFAIREEKVSKEFADIHCADYVLLQFCKDPVMKKMLYSAMSYISFRMQSDTEDEQYKTIPRSFVQPRRWIYNPKCPYHISRLSYPYKHNLTYSDFTTFIEAIQGDWIGDTPSEDLSRNVDFDGFLKNELDPDELTDVE